MDQLFSLQVPITYADGRVVQTLFKVAYENMVGTLQHTAKWSTEQSLIPVRRLSTQSYARRLLSPTSETDLLPAACPWRWHYEDGSTWKMFEAVSIEHTYRKNK